MSKKDNIDQRVNNFTTQINELQDKTNRIIKKSEKNRQGKQKQDKNIVVNNTNNKKLKFSFEDSDDNEEEDK